MTSRTEFIVRYAETDQMGITHHSVYPIWFEAGRTDLVKLCGLTYGEVEQKGVLMPLLELKCEYKSYSGYEDVITVLSSVKQITCTRVTFYYEVYKKNRELPVCTGETMHAFTDRALKPFNLKKKFPDIYKAFSTI